MKKNGLKSLVLIVFCTLSMVVKADAASDVDRNIKIIFPPELMSQMIDATTPGMMSHLKFKDENDKQNTQNATNTFHKEFLNKFQKLIADSLKQNFTPQELAEWASFQSTPLGKKATNWMRTKYPEILNKSMEGSMDDLYKNLGGK